ncbi:hypothetical protein FDP41_002520 [Naegleria fowleri]|uniref:Uncharacterized protein n=1 Tax=Naegleria fowleri TaxID=5763 RepID=A0A6A5BYQ2_NAEFO|nr:uncharacterized protein FDP41_002520 [Naegleria fowleri]KAF0978700.1 hypothetical protein FDP41_002520 [Naegleria fowleri]
MVFVLSCGSNVYSQCCQKGSEKITTLSPITLLPEGVSLVNVKKIACGREHTMMLLRDGRLFGIGHNQHGQIFGKTQAQYSEFLKIDSSSFLSVGDTIVDVFCTQINTYVITECGKIYWSGWENLHSEKNYLKMQNMDGIKSIDYFVTNSNAVHCFISSHGKLFSCGWNSHGQLSIGTKIDSYGALQEVDFDVRKIKCIALGAQFSVLATTDDVLYGCGSNGDFQLSSGYSTSDVFSVIDTPFKDKKIRNIVCGGFHTLVQLENEEIWGCGKNISSDTFVQLDINEPIRAMGAGWQFFICLGESMKLYVCGTNTYGQLSTSNCDDQNHITCLPPHPLITSYTEKTVFDCGEFYTFCYSTSDCIGNHFIFMQSILNRANGITNKETNSHYHSDSLFLSDINILSSDTSLQ